MRSFQNLRRRHHHPEIDHIVVVTLQHHANDILPDIVDVAFDRGHDDARLRFRGCRFLRFHERHQVGHGFFHHSRGFHYLRQKHLAGAEQIADHTHPGHERAFDDLERFGKSPARFFGVSFNEIDDAVHECVLQPFLHWSRAPGFFLHRLFHFCLHAIGEINQPLRGVIAPI